MNLNLHQNESEPETYPAVEGVTGDALAVAWQRIEAYIKKRYAPRQVEWLVQGETGGVWYPPLGPVVSIQGEIVDGAVPFTPMPWGPGFRLPQGVVKLTATVGAGPVPTAVSNALRRLANYYAAVLDVPEGVRSYSLNVGDMSESISVQSGRMARAMQESGAADLLRPYRSQTSWLS